MARATSDQRTSNDVPMVALYKKSRIVAALVPAVFNFRSIEICMGKIKNASIKGVHNDQRHGDRSTELTESFLLVNRYLEFGNG